MPLRTSPAPARLFPRFHVAGFLALLLLTLVAVRQQGEALRGEAIRVCVRVVAEGDDEADVPDCGQISLRASSSSPSTSSDSGTSSASTSSAAATTGASEGGGRRGDTLRAISRTRSLLREWALRRVRLHAAPRTQTGALWYDSSILLLQERGILTKEDMADARLEDGALRREVATLLVRAFPSQEQQPSFARSSFMDVRSRSADAAAIEEAARRGWMLGYRNCFGRSFCLFRPQRTITRAEALQVLVRLKRLQPRGEAPPFKDIQPGAWYAETLRIAADHCILQGEHGLARPTEILSRAEFFVMLARVMEAKTYARDCRREDASADRRATVSAVSGEEEAICTEETLRCLLGALRQDIRTYGGSLLSATLAFTGDWRAPLPRHATEWVPAMLLVVWILWISHWCHHAFRRSQALNGAA